MKYSAHLVWMLALVLTLATTTRAADSNSLKTREFRVDGLRQNIPLLGALHQNLRCWQVTEGNWNGQALAGLTLVLVQTFPDSPQADASSFIYVSDFASPAQREAFITAMKAARPMLFTDGNGNSLRVEPAVITIEQVDQSTIVLRLAPIA